MRSPLALLPLLSLTLSACGAPKLALPADPIGKAATCGVVSAAEARSAGAEIGAPLSFERQGEIIHYALLAGAGEKDFSRDRVAAVMQRMQEIQEDVTEGKWKDLIQPCQAAFPQANRALPVELPSDPLQAQMGCYMLGQFMAKALAAQGSDYDKQTLEFGAMNRKLDPKIASGLDRRGVRSEPARKAQQDAALAAAAKLGSPAKVMNACTSRFA